MGIDGRLDKNAMILAHKTTSNALAYISRTEAKEERTRKKAIAGMCAFHILRCRRERATLGKFVKSLLNHEIFTSCLPLLGVGDDGDVCLSLRSSRQFSHSKRHARHLYILS